MKALKGYFLFFSKHPIWYGFCIWLISLGAMYATDYVLGTNVLTDWSAWTLSAAVIVHTVVVYVVIGRYILRPERVFLFDDDSYFCQGVVFKDSRRPEILRKPIWADGIVVNVAPIPNYYGRSSVLSFDLSCGGKFRNTMITIPVKIELQLYNSFSHELFHTLLNNAQENGDNLDNTLYLEKYVKRVFQKFNQPQQPLIDDLIQRYAQQSISTAALLDEVISILVFPERLFANISGTKICLSDPTISSCKGMACSA